MTIYDPSSPYLIIFCLVLCGVGYFIFLPAWIGADKEWILHRGWGYPPLLGLSIAAFSQGGIFASIMTMFDPPEEGVSTFIGAVSLFLAAFNWLVVLPVALWGRYFPLPRFLLPGWIKEFLATGELDLSDEWGEVIDEDEDLTGELPFTSRVQVVRWLVSGVVCVGLGVVSVLLFWSLAVTGSASGISRVWWPAFPVMGVFLVVLGVYFLWGGVRPEHVVLDERGLRTRSWDLVWGEVVGVRELPSKIVVEVRQGAADRVRKANRWHSGRPGGVGGLLAVGNTVGLQSSLLDHDVTYLIIKQKLNGDNNA